MFDNELLLSFRTCFLTLVAIGMNSSEGIEGLVTDVMQDVGFSLPRILRLANGLEYTIVVAEVAKRSTYFSAMFRENRFSESTNVVDVIELDLPDNDWFDAIYTFLMTGTYDLCEMGAFM